MMMMFRLDCLAMNMLALATLVLLTFFRKVNAGLAYRIYNNTALAGLPISTGIAPCAQLALPSTPSSGELSGSISFLNYGIYQFDCTFVQTTTAWVWVDGHLVCGDGNAYHLKKGSFDNPLVITPQNNRTLPFRAHVTSINSNSSFKVEWSNLSIKNQTIIDTAKQLHPHLSVPEQERDELQRGLVKGWGSWLHQDIMSLVKLPEGATLSLKLCQLSSRSCINSAIPDSNTRVGHFAWNRSYVSTFISGLNANISMEYAVSGNKLEELDLLVTTVDCDGNNCSDYKLQVHGRYAWFRAGTAAVAGLNALTFTTPGLGTIHVTATNDTSANSLAERRLRAGDNQDIFLQFPLPSVGESVGLSTMGPKPTSTIQAILVRNRKAEESRLQTKFGSKAQVAQAIQAAVMWTLVYNPVENNALFLPVSRSWACGGNSGPTNADWNYCLFDWDLFFASLLAGLDSAGKDIAYSNLFQIVKSKTAAGFIPNVAAAGGKSQDRTEPPVGAKVVLELFQKYQEKWVVQVVFDVLLDWNNWFLSNRILEPAGLVALGSYNQEADLVHVPNNVSRGENTMQGARWESGLDNSPMYDGEFFENNTTHLMQLYDVGMSSMFAQEAYSLAELADAIGRRKEGKMLRARGNAMRDKIREYLWDDEMGIFTNRFPNGTFSHRISPTSFYALQTGAATDKQASDMVMHYLLNASRFCVSPNGNFAGNHDACYWGLPSTSADDPSYMSTGFIYWRGYVWGPMAQLVYWSLKQYEHVPAVKLGLTALCKQMESLMMSQWNRNRHVCENYNPRKNATDCSGTHFYHWGALTGLIGMMADGFW